MDSKANTNFRARVLPKLVLLKVFHLEKFCDNAILTKISGLWSFESALSYRKLLFIVRAINRYSEDNVHKLFFVRIGSFLKQPDDSIGLVKDLAAMFKKYMTYMTFFWTGPQRTNALTFLNGNSPWKTELIPTKIVYRKLISRATYISPYYKKHFLRFHFFISRLGSKGKHSA